MASAVLPVALVWVDDVITHCELISNVDQTNCDGDAEGDVCDADDDNDGVLDVDDQCPKSPLGWLTNPSVDFDQDGCHDMNEDWDDDGDGADGGWGGCGGDGGLVWSGSGLAISLFPQKLCLNAYKTLRIYSIIRLWVMASTN